MKSFLIKQILLVLPLAFFLFGCKKNNVGNTGGGGSGGTGGGGGGTTFNITGTSPEYLYWGDELTIQGSGFSTNKTDYTFKFISGFPNCNTTENFVVVSATANQLKVKLPVGISSTSGRKCGPSSDQVVVSIKGKSDTTDEIRFLGWPRLMSVCTHFGGWSGNYIIPGDSVALNISGATGIFASVNNHNKNAELTANGIPVPIKWRNYTACNSHLGGVITLDIKDFAEVKCSTDPDWGGGGRMVKFKVSNPGTDRFDTTSIFVEWMPRNSYGGVQGPATVSMADGQSFPTWTISGKNMSYDKARFTSTNCNVTPQHVNINHDGKFFDKGTIPIPLSVLNAGCTYTVSLVSPCNTVKVIGSVKIVP